jgi:hypothetical protein
MSFQRTRSKPVEKDAEIVTVDSSGFYSGAVGMEEIYNCVGVVSVHEDRIYAAHISPGSIGEEPGSMMEGFQEGSSNYIVAGSGADSGDALLEFVKSELEDVEETYLLDSFTADLEGNVTEGFDYSTESPLI